MQQNQSDYKGKRKLLAALFPEKVILENEECRTTKLNEVLVLVASIIKDSEMGENKNSSEIHDSRAIVPEAERISDFLKEDIQLVLGFIL